MMYIYSNVKTVVKSSLLKLGKRILNTKKEGRSEMSVNACDRNYNRNVTF